MWLFSFLVADVPYTRFIDVHYMKSFHSDRSRKRARFEVKRLFRVLLAILKSFGMEITLKSSKTIEI